MVNGVKFSLMMPDNTADVHKTLLALETQKLSLPSAHFAQTKREKRDAPKTRKDTSHFSSFEE